FNPYIFIALILSALFKEWMARFSNFLGSKINSQALIADAWHHRSDAIATLLVCLSLLLAKFNLFKVDGIIGLIVSGFVAWVGIDIAKNSSSFLMGESPDQKLIDQIKNIISSTPGALDCHDLSVHDYSNSKFITLHIEVKKDLPTTEAHSIALKVQKAIQEKIPEATVIVHIDPEGEKEES
ncbi:MAG: cation diffusion facilitator family transporter, partial [Chloroflexi bacterium]|nr:cation diffusion facilitator family transporter [Chloroflexota bacterium]